MGLLDFITDLFSDDDEKEERQPSQVSYSNRRRVSDDDYDDRDDRDDED